MQTTTKGTRSQRNYIIKGAKLATQLTMMRCLDIFLPRMFFTVMLLSKKRHSWRPFYSPDCAAVKSLRETIQSYLSRTEAILIGGAPSEALITACLHQAGGVISRPYRNPIGSRSTHNRLLVSSIESSKQWFEAALALESGQRIVRR